MDEIMALVVKLVATLLALGLTFLSTYLWNALKKSDLFKQISEWVKAKVGEQSQKAIDEMIDQFTAAADQMVKSGSMKREDRLAYVTQCLNDIGVEVTNIIRAKIEASVYRLPSIEDQK